MNKYNESKIYKITSEHTYKIYIGSTTKNLNDRITGHKSNYNKWKDNKTRPYCSSYKLYNLGDIKYELLELYKCNNKKELLQREAYYIKQNYNLVVNKNKPTLSEEEKIEWQKEYYVKNKEQIDKHQKEYYEKNKEKFKEYYEKNKEQMDKRSKRYYEKNKELFKEYYAKNKERIYQQQKEYYAKNKERINQRQKEHRAKKKANLI